MVKSDCFKYVGLFLAIFLHSSLALNDTEKSSSQSFVVSANLGVSEHNKQNSAHNEEDTQNFLAPSPNSFQQYEGYTENSLFVNKNYQDYSKSYSSSNEQNEGHSGSAEHPHNQNNEAYLNTYPKNAHYHGNDEILPAPSEWKANFDPNPCQRYGGSTHSGSETFDHQSYYGNYAEHPESTTSIQPFQNHQEKYLHGALNRNEVIDPLPITSYHQSYSPNIAYGVQNTYNSDEYQGQHSNNVENIVLGNHNNNEGQDSQWIGTNRKISNDRAYDGQKDWTTGNQRTDNSDTMNDSHKPNVVELQEMISKIIKGNSKVHQVLKVPAVYEIHLQEEENSSGHAPIQQNGIHSHLNQMSTQKWKSQSFARPPQHWHKKTPPSSSRPTRNPQLFRRAHPSTKTWNLPSKINYFNSRDSLGEGSHTSNGKYAYPKPFSSTGTGQEIPLQKWYNSPSSNNHYPNSKLTDGGAPVYGSVSVPMTPGSTEVTFLDNDQHFGHQTNIDTTLLNSPEIRPDLSNYYAKKKEIENSSFQGSNANENGYRGNSVEGTRRNFRRNYRIPLRKKEERNFFPLNTNLNYIIYVREKSRG